MIIITSKLCKPHWQIKYHAVSLQQKVMKKILAIFDATKYSATTSRYAIELAKSSNSMLVGVFIRDMRFSNFSYSYVADVPFVDFNAIEESNTAELEKAALNIYLFKHACDKVGVHHKVHLDKGVPIQEVIKESAYADLIVVDAKTSFFSFDDNTPAHFLKDILADCYCPILIVPADYHAFEKIVLCYDGSPSSTFAIKMFAYLFPELRSIQATVVTVNATVGNHLQQESNLKDLIKQHFHKVDYSILRGKVEEELMQFLKQENENAVVVMGAYGRSSLSRFIHHSLSNRIIKDISLPVFITHY